MSVQAIYRVQCSGWCQKWLGVYPDGSFDAVYEWDDYLASFETWHTANEYAAKADWFDGPQGEYAKCTCDRNPYISNSSSNPHSSNCRVMKPRMVPICPDCRRSM